MAPKCYAFRTCKRTPNHQLRLWVHGWMLIPIGSMYGIFTYIYHKNQPNVGIWIYQSHGSYGIGTFWKKNSTNHQRKPTTKRSAGRLSADFWVRVTDALFLGDLGGWIRYVVHLEDGIPWWMVSVVFITRVRIASPYRHGGVTNYLPNWEVPYQL